ncbi:GNAT family N-acetyltransferase [Paenibacillus alvei]|uniref:GNAT family N-acetyltransferase n=1 Tax=Paenibacillus alvei TaxID=44250 RepID=UPI0013DA7DC3|nr:GNAT family N-acetyltransferase [Paenibacillus alvei]NEZ44093.1 GNAT family N-acetyltransferase [Paenibacillus alvei]
MIVELERDQFYKCTDLVNCTTMLESKAIVAGNNPGRIFVDHADTPKFALIWQGNLDGFLFVGDASNSSFNRGIKVYMDEVIREEALKLGLKWAECIGTHPSWNTAIEHMFADRELFSWISYVRSLMLPDYKHEAIQLPDGEYEIVQVSKELLQNKSILNHSFLVSRVLDYWESTERFLQDGGGFCVMHNHSVASLCITGFRYRHIHALGIVTIDQYRGRKLAQISVRAYVEHLFSRGQSMCWDCTASNKPSNAIAERIGFQREMSYRGYRYKL